MNKDELKSANIPLEAPPVLDKALKSLEEALGGRDEIVSKLAIAPELTQEETTILNLLAAPENKGRSLAYLCGSAGTTLNRLLELMRKGAWAKAYVDAMNRIYRQLPAVAEDVMSRALPRSKSCLACKAQGTLPPVKEGDEPQTCLTCEGLGRVEIAPDLERQKMALEAGGLLRSGGNSSSINIDNRRQTVNGPVVLVKSTPDFRTATDRLLYPAKIREMPVLGTVQPTENFITAATPVDAELIEEPDVFGKDI